MRRIFSSKYLGVWIGAALIYFLTVIYWIPEFLSERARPPRGSSNLVSLIQLIAHPESYEGEWVDLRGVLKIDSRESALYFGPQDALHQIPVNSVPLLLDEDQIEAYRNLSGEYVLLQGRFSARKRGPLRLASGSLEYVQGIIKNPTLRERELEMLEDLRDTP
jgi:hypothetical protein